MKTTIDRYNKLTDMELLDGAKYDLNMRVEMIFREVQQMLQRYENEARAIYYPESINKESKQ